VLEFVPYERLAWDGHVRGLNVYHAWLIKKTDNGCHVLTEEMQHGLLARLGKAFRPKQIEQMHQVWLKRLRDKASSGLPFRAQ